jgi:hypothetical protein
MAIFAAMLFVLGFAASAFAIHAEIPAETSAIVVKGDSTLTLSGELRFRGEIRETDFNDDTSMHSNYDGRVRIGLDVKVAPNATGFVQLETGTDDCESDFAAGEDVSCNGDTTDTYLWGQPSNRSSGGVYRNGNTKRGDLRLLQAWINYKPMDMLGVKVGHMPLALGNKIFFNHTKFGDDAIVVYADPNKNLHIAALTIKLSEDNPGSYDDADAYVGLATYKGGIFNVGGNITYLVDQTINGTTIDNVDLTNFGVNGDVKVGPVTIWADAEIQSGKINQKNSLVPFTFFGCDGISDCDISATAFTGGIKVPLGPIMLAVDGGQGSGDSDGSDPTKTPDDDFEMFVTALGSHGNAPLYTYVYDYRLAGASGSSQNGIANTTFAAVRASGKATKNISWKAQLVFLSATEDTSVCPSCATGQFRNPITGLTETSDELGFEVDASITIQLAKGLKYWIEGGFLSAGDAYRYNGPIVPVVAPFGTEEDPDAAYAVRNGIALNF